MKANQPKTDAEADLAQAKAVAEMIAAQGATGDRLTNENKRLSERVTHLDQVIDEITKHNVEINKRNDELVRSVRSLTNRVETIDHALDDAHEQNELLAAEVKAAEERAVAAEKRAEAAEKRAEAAERRAEVAEKQNAILIAHFRAMDEWVQTNYTAEHPTGGNPPPKLQTFEAVE